MTGIDQCKKYPRLREGAGLVFIITNHATLSLSLDTNGRRQKESFVTKALKRAASTRSINTPPVGPRQLSLGGRHAARNHIRSAVS